MTFVASDQKRFEKFCEGLTLDNQAAEHVLNLSNVRLLFRGLLNIEALAQRGKRNGYPDARHYERFVAEAGLKPLSADEELLR